MEQCLGHCEMAGRRMMRDGACRRYAAAVAMAEWRMFVEAVWRRTYGTQPPPLCENQPLHNIFRCCFMAGYLTCPYGTSLLQQACVRRGGFPCPPEKRVGTRCPNPFYMGFALFGHRARTMHRAGMETRPYMNYFTNTFLPLTMYMPPLVIVRTRRPLRS